jgi:putative AlgH/UPF0301 family transcriptional regulator
LIRSKKQPKASLRIFDDVFLSADRKVLQQVLRHPRPFAGLQIFSGYAGWKPGQLEAEVEKGYWLLREADTEILFNTEPGLVWRKLLDSPGKGYQSNLMEINLLSNLFEADYFRIRTVVESDGNQSFI